MKKKINGLLCIIVFACMLATGCADTENTAGTVTSSQEESVSKAAEETSGQEKSQDQTEPKSQSDIPAVENGIYTAEFHTDSGMFHVNESCHGKGTLIVEDGEMVIHISLTSKNIVNLFPGLAKDAQKDGAELLEPTTDTVTYDDGTTEEVYGFDVPVPALEEEFDLALLGKKGKWYDHKVSVSNPEAIIENAASGPASASPAGVDMEDGEYTVDLKMDGGSGRATINSPAVLIVKDGLAYARIEWSSSHYDYMKVGEEKYLPVNSEGNSVFEIPITAFDQPVTVIGDTTAMSTPHEVEYTLTFYKSTVKPEK